ncbi:KIF1-binding protein homolog [Trichogramma pretiosum]|uniref:KIF1-binding protein homolog n=1 Tax=Trichogramma pretiosum TaxID=7493 RepID=UPI0006C95D78|nr:KIF1-binding protein homolog [Trichogramma pretiosum]
MSGRPIFDEAFKADLKEKYLAYKKLADEDSKNDSESDPYKSKYAAMEILKELRHLLLTCSTTSDAEQYKVDCMLGIVYLDEGILALDAEELNTGEELLMNCINTLNKYDVKKENILPTLRALNQLAILWSKREQTLTAKEYIDKAVRIYEEYQLKDEADNTPIDAPTLFEVEDVSTNSTKDELEKLHTLTLYYLAQVYGALEDLFKSAIYCHMTLKRQLEMNDYDSIDWSLNTATLSQFFMESKGFKQARHHLAAATLILQKHEDHLKSLSSKEPADEAESELIAAKWEIYNHRKADVSRCWAKYGILLMRDSRDRLIAASQGYPSCAADDTNVKDPKADTTPISQKLLDSFKFHSIEKDIEDIANNITDKYLLDFDDAKKVFLNVQKWLEEAKSYYTLEDQASEYVQIIQDMSELYRYLIFFEESDDRQAKMHKRRIDLLEGVVKQLNETYYLSVCQQIWIELGETYSEILNIKLDRLKDKDEKPTVHLITKVNNLAKSAILNYKKFIDSVALSKKDNRFPEEFVKPVLTSYYHIGRLYNVFITGDKLVKLENTKKSWEAYKFVAEYCKKNMKPEELKETEYSLSIDFADLLPVKIAKLTRELSN